MINGYHAFSLVQDKWNLHALANERFVRYIVSPEVHSLVGTISSLCGQISEPLHQLQYDAKLRDAAIVLSDYQCEGSRAEATALDWLHEVVESSSCSNLSRAWSYYLLGSTALKEARKSGDLQRLWDDSLDQQRCTVSSLSAAQRFFGEALILLGSACDILKRNVERCLALVTGPGTTDNDKNLDSFCLINSSVGGAVRFHMMRSARGTEDNEGAGNGDSNGSSLAAIYGALEHSPSNTSASKSKKWFLNLLGKNIRPGWRFITAALCPTGELLLTSVEYSESLEDYFHCTTCIFPGLDGQSDSCDDLYDEIVKPLNEIVQRSQEQLSEETAAFANIAEKEECARQWWSRRKEVDSELHDLLVRVEQKLLSSNTVQRILLGFSHGDGSLENTDDSLKMSCGNLSSKFEAASIADGQEWKFNVTELSPSKSTEVQRKLEEEDMEAKFGRKIKKSGLARLARQEHESKGAGKYGRFEPTPHAKHACTFLILDESLQRFPFESMSCFKESAICRLPSLPFALAKLVEANKNGASAFSFHPEQTSYILDPESNLSGTKERLLPFLDSLNEKYGAHWKSVVGEIPSSEFMNQGLTAIDGLLLYFGHSGGQQYFSRERIRDMSRMTQGSLASVILMGCSSGKLESVNTKHSTSKEKLPIHYEPEGIALSYLIEGAPCVVGNLWDVTDRDIDRYAMSLLDAVFVNSSDNSIAQSVAMARSACKLRYVVGCAPVCYGLPITGRNMPR